MRVKTMVKTGNRQVLAVAAITALCGATMASAQTRVESEPSIRVTGVATATAEPDQAEIDIGVMTQAPTSQRAASENAARLTKVLDAVQRHVGAAGSTKTAGYSIRPDYRYPREGAKPEVVGYTATNTVRTTTSDLTGIGQLIDAALGAGANRVERIQFSLKDDLPVRTQVLREAARRARAEAEALASALDLKIVRVLSVTEESPPIRPMFETFRASAGAADAATPVEPGTIEIQASVVLTLEIAGR
jgi:uncharacterized protein YggE